MDEQTQTTDDGFIVIPNNRPQPRDDFFESFLGLDVESDSGLELVPTYDDFNNMLGF